MKRLSSILFFIIAFFPTSYAQLTGIPELDSLVEKRSRIRFQCILGAHGDKCDSATEILDFQIHQWRIGKEEKLCMFLVAGEVSYRECGIDPGFYPSYIKDTLIYLPAPINFQSYMDWKIKRLSNH